MTGVHFNEKLLENRQFRNPNIYEKLIEYADLDEYFSLLPIRVSNAQKIDIEEKTDHRPKNILYSPEYLMKYLQPSFGNVDSALLTCLQKSKYDSEATKSHR